MCCPTARDWRKRMKNLLRRQKESTGYGANSPGFSKPCYIPKEKRKGIIKGNTRELKFSLSSLESKSVVRGWQRLEKRSAASRIGIWIRLSAKLRNIPERRWNLWMLPTE